ncbi:nuclear transport factor 2 family protein [Aquihabitans sp. G128]|uniref:AtzH-like domain-containing protein n=1 Tax=Aquihabitans sp. G128 TaxID=2849779 RepID=UPI001C24AA3F|nr:AtzH-like domain-containing protein [Aquihabitans sp. G128]QXC61056.1 nuclear transport factor 2 family protein [Aquihabitans sp. G128]
MAAEVAPTGAVLAEDELAALAAATHAYEDALAAGDGVGAAAFFDDQPDTSRFGPEGAQLDLAAVRALRAATGATPPATWRHDAIRPLSPATALHLAVLERGGATIHRTQVWARRPDGWRIVHAHVSRLAASS